MSKELTVYDFDTTQRVSMALYKSGYFTDVKSEAQAIVKVMAGQELGLPPFASMTGIHIIKGKPVLGSNVIATLVKNDPRYDYKVTASSNTECRITWFENGELRGAAGFTIQEAQAAGLAGKQNWKSYPSDMLFARAISRGARRFAPGIFGGAPVYTPDEMGADVDPDGYVEGEIVTDDNEHIADRILAHSQAGAEPERTVDDINDELGYPEAEQPDVPRSKPQPEQNDNGNGEAKIMGAVAFKEWLAETLGYKNTHHVMSTMKLFDWTSTPSEPEERKKVYAALQAYRAHREEGLNQDEALVAMASDNSKAEEGSDA